MRTFVKYKEQFLVWKWTGIKYSWEQSLYSYRLCFYL